jgi:O-antigen/teichoic acid export membrane protein
VIAWLGVMAIPVGSGVNQLVTREASRRVQSENWSLISRVCCTANYWVLVYGFGLAVLVTIFLGLLDGVRSDIFYFASMAVPAITFIGLSNIRAGTLRGLGFPVASVVPELIVKPVFMLLTIALLFYVKGSVLKEDVIIGYVCAIIFAFLMGSYLLRFHVGHNLSSVRKSCSTSSWFPAYIRFSAVSFVGLLSGSMGVLVLGLFGPSSSVGALQIAISLSNLVVLPLLVINLTIPYNIVKFSEEKDRDSLQLLLKKSALLCAMVSVPVSLVFIVFSKPIIGYLYGEDYVDLAYNLLTILIVGQFVNSVFGPVGQVLSMSGYEREVLKGYATGLLVNFLICLSTIPVLGPIGAALGSSAGLIFNNLFFAKRCKDILDISSIFTIK